MTVLRNRAFARLFAAHLVSQVGSGVTLLALPLIAAIDLGATPFQVGLLSAAEAAPLLVLGLLAGVWADRRRRRPLMVAADLLRCGLLLTIPLAAWQGWLRFETLLAVALLAGALAVVFDVAAQSYVVGLLRRDELVQGNGLLHTGYAAGEVTGPGLAGALIQAVGAPVAMAVDALSFLLSGALVGSIRAAEPDPPPTTGRSLRADLGEGLRVVARTPILRDLGLATGIWNLFDNARGAMLVLFLNRDLGMEPGPIGLVYAVASGGWLVGTALPGPAARRLGLGRAILVGVAANLPGSLLVVVAGGPPAVAAGMVAVGLFVEGVAGSVYDVNQFSLRQASTPARLQGRVGATLRVAIRGVVPLGALLGGVLAGTEGIGLRGVMGLALLGPPLAFALLWASPVRTVRAMPEEAP